MKKILSVIFAMFMALTVLAGCGTKPPAETGKDSPEASPSNTSAGWAYIENKGELIVGLDATFAPMGFTDEKGDIIGFDIDLANAVGENLGIKVKFEPIDWDAKDIALSSKRIDCIWNGMSINPERQESMALTQAYLNNKMVIMGKNADAITSIDDLKGKKIGVQAKSEAQKVLEADPIYESVKNDVSVMPTYDEIILDMKAGRIEVMIVDEVFGEYKNTTLAKDDKLKVAPVDFGDDLYAIGCRKGETDLAAKLEGAIKELIKSGKAKEISEKWFGENLVLDMK